MTVRSALTGQLGGASLSEIMQFIGKDATVARLTAASKLAP